MVSFRNGAKAFATLALVNRAIAELPPIIAKGQYFFYSNNGSQFFMKGVAYQQGIQVDGAPVEEDHKYTDPLADTTSCTRDIPFLKKAGTNTIRVYAIDPEEDHSTCMKLLDDAGIYVVADLSSPAESIDRVNPSWTLDHLERYTKVIDEMAKYSNVIGFFAGNEVANNASYTPSSAFVKAAVRDSKKFIKSKNYGRWLGVGYANNDDPETRDNLASYFNCGDPEEAVDFWGFNIYEWCGESTFKTSGYEERTKEFEKYSVPAFFAEYGCNTKGGGANRLFQDTGVLYSSQMNKVWSGGIVYGYFNEENDYGLVDIKGNSVTPNQGYTNLASQIKASSFPTNTVNQAAYSPTNTPRACPAVSTQGAEVWEAVSSPLPPSPDAEVCDCMFSGLKCKPSDKVLNNATAIGELFGTVCGLLDGKACNGIQHNAATGDYGVYSGCTPGQQLAHALDEYYTLQKKAADACSFGGKAVLDTKATAASKCGDVLSSASSAAGDKGGNADKKDAASGLGFGQFAMVGYVVAAMAVGGAMVVL
ncbi:Glucanosyltransferase domain containing protein [Rhypophila decipiens]